MSQSFISNQSGVMQTALKVQELCLRLEDTQIVSVSANDLTVDVGQTISEVRLFAFFDDSAETNNPRNASHQTISGSTVKVALGATPTSSDSFTIKYVIDPTAS